MTFWTEEEAREGYRGVLKQFEGREIDDALTEEIKNALAQFTADAIKNGHLPETETP